MSLMFIITKLLHLFPEPFDLSWVFIRSSHQGLREGQLGGEERGALPLLAAQVHHRQEGRLHPEDH